MDLLHGTVAEELIAEIKAYRNGERLLPTKFDKEGIALPRDVAPVPSSLIAQAVKFLKDNGIDMPARKTDRLDPLEDLLAEEDEYQGNVAKFPERS